MVEMVISLIITMSALAVIVEVQTQTEAVRRVNQGSQSAQYNGLVALQTLDLATKKSGFGMNMPTYAGYTINYYDPSSSSAKTEVLAPALISAGSATTNAVLRLMWSDNNISVVPSKLLSKKMASDTSQQITNMFGVKAGDLMLYIEDGKPGVVHQVSAVDVPTQTIQHAISALYPYNTDFSAVYPSSGYTTAGRLFDWGSWVRQEYRVQNNQLWVRQTTAAGTNDSVLADNVLSFRAQYGMDDGGSGGAADDGVPDTWTYTSPSNTNDWTRVVAMKYAVLTRNEEQERSQEVTNAMPTWSGGTFDVSSNPNWKKIRYRVYEAVIPLKNNVWKTPDV